MTVPAATYPVRHTLSGSAETVQVPYYFPDGQFLKVTLMDTSGVVTELEYNVDYEVTGAKNPSGGHVELGAGVGAATDQCTVYLDIPISQLLDFQYADGFRSQDIEDALDRITSILRMYVAELANTLKIPIEEAATLGATELPSDVAGKILYFDATTGDLDLKTPAELQAIIEG
jgi:hypothetical protein